MTPPNPKFLPEILKSGALFFIFIFLLCMEVRYGSDISGDPFDVRMNELTLILLKTPACRRQNRGARGARGACGARRNSNFLMYIGYVS